MTFMGDAADFGEHESFDAIHVRQCTDPHS